MTVEPCKILGEYKNMSRLSRRFTPVRKILYRRVIISLLCLLVLVACSPIKTIHVWKDPTYTKKLHNVLVISIIEQDYMRRQAENLLTLKLNELGIAAIPSYEVLPQHGTDISREEVVAKVKQLGVDTVLVGRSILKDSMVNYQPDGARFAVSGMYSNGWYSMYVGEVVYPVKEYDIDYFTVATTLFDVGRKKPVWSDLSRVKVSGSRQAAINEFIPVLVKRLTASGILE
jgi:hypothetical protein